MCVYNIYATLGIAAHALITNSLIHLWILFNRLANT